MLELIDIPHLRVNKYKVYLPRDEKAASMYSIVFANNINVDDNLMLMSHPLLVTNSKYLTYFIEPLYNTRVHNKKIYINYRDNIKQIHTNIKNEFRMIKTPLKFDMVNNRNVYYDMSVHNKIFFDNMRSYSIKTKIELYFDYLKVLINNPQFHQYKNKMVFMDVESWMRYNTINNPITYMLISFRRFYDIFKSLGNIDIYLYSKDKIMRVNPSLCEQSHFSIFKRELNKVYNNSVLNSDEELDTAIQKQEIKDVVAKDLNDKYGFTGVNTLEVDDDNVVTPEDEIDPDDIPEIDDDIKDTVNHKINAELDAIQTEEPELDPDKIESKLQKRLDEDKELIGFMHDTIREKKVGKSTASIKRDAELREKQKKIKIANRTVGDYINNPKASGLTLPSSDISDKTTTTNTNVTKVRFNNFEKEYNNNVMENDTINILAALNDKTVKTYIKDIKIEDSSDELNYKSTYRIVLEDENRVRHNLTFDVPNFIEDKFLYLNGSKKIINKQLTMKPIVKTGADTVQVCSNYNKIFIQIKPL